MLSLVAEKEHFLRESVFFNVTFLYVSLKPVRQKTDIATTLAQVIVWRWGGCGEQGAWRSRQRSWPRSTSAGAQNRPRRFPRPSGAAR